MVRADAFMSSRFFSSFDVKSPLLAVRTRRRSSRSDILSGRPRRVLAGLDASALLTAVVEHEICELGPIWSRSWTKTNLRTNTFDIGL